MAPKTLPRAVLQEALDTVRECGGNVAEAARRLGVARPTLQHRLEQAQRRNVTAPEFEPPDLPSEELSDEELIERMTEGFERRQKAAQARQWMRFKIKVKGPFGLVFMGDPHLDDNGCNWPLLRRDVELLRETDALFGVGMGDYTNNWSGRLAQKIYPYQEATRPQAWQLARWLFRTVPWFLLIKGNHDLWSGAHGTGDPLDWMERGAAPLEDWQARFAVQCPNGREFRVWAAHDFPGSSIYNPLHSNMRAAKFTGLADLYVSGDKHNWALFQTEDADRGVTYWTARARGYKFLDSYAERLGHASQQNGASIAAIFDPETEGPAALQCFADVAEAVKYLKWKRSRA